jgi:hypothetical protein
MFKSMSFKDYRRYKNNQLTEKEKKDYAYSIGLIHKGETNEIGKDVLSLFIESQEMYGQKLTPDFLDTQTYITNHIKKGSIMTTNSILRAEQYLALCEVSLNKARIEYEGNPSLENAQTYSDKFDSVVSAGKEVDRLHYFANRL